VSREWRKGVLSLGSALAMAYMPFPVPTPTEVLAQDVGSGTAGATWCAEGHDGCTAGVQLFCLACQSCWYDRKGRRFTTISAVVTSWGHNIRTRRALKRSKYY
jgi:hypothetical protein